MFWFLKKKRRREHIYADDLVGAIGKLPVHREFIKHRVVLSELAQLDQWFQSAYRLAGHKYGQGLKALFKTMPVYNYLFISGAKQPMIGSIISSYDQVGRVYPFVLFRILENPLALEFMSAVPIIYDDYFAAGEQLFFLAADGVSLPEIFARINELKKLNSFISRYELLKSVYRRLTGISFAALWQNIRLQYPRLNLDSFLQAIIAVFRKIASQKSILSPWGLRLPLGTKNNFMPSLLFWLQLLARATKKGDCLIQYFWNNEHALFKPTLLVFFKPMPAEYFMLFLDQNYIHENFYDLTALENFSLDASIEIKRIKSSMSLSLYNILHEFCNVLDC